MSIQPKTVHFYNQGYEVRSPLSETDDKAISEVLKLILDDNDFRRQVVDEFRVTTDQELDNPSIEKSLKVEKSGKKFILHCYVENRSLPPIPVDHTTSILHEAAQFIYDTTTQTRGQRPSISRQSSKRNAPERASHQDERFERLEKKMRRYQAEYLEAHREGIDRQSRRIDDLGQTILEHQTEMFDEHTKILADSLERRDQELAAQLHSMATKHDIAPLQAQVAQLAASQQESLAALSQKIEQGLESQKGILKEHFAFFLQQNQERDLEFKEYLAQQFGYAHRQFFEEQNKILSAHTQHLDQQNQSIIQAHAMQAQNTQQALNEQLTSFLQTNAQRDQAIHTSITELSERISALSEGMLFRFITVTENIEAFLTQAIQTAHNQTQKNFRDVADAIVNNLATQIKVSHEAQPKQQTELAANTAKQLERMTRHFDGNVRAVAQKAEQIFERLGGLERNQLRLGQHIVAGTRNSQEKYEALQQQLDEQTRLLKQLIAQTEQEVSGINQSHQIIHARIAQLAREIEELKEILLGREQRTPSTTLPLLRQPSFSLPNFGNYQPFQSGNNRRREPFPNVVTFPLVPSFRRNPPPAAENATWSSSSSRRQPSNWVNIFKNFPPEIANILRRACSQGIWCQS